METISVRPQAGGRDDGGDAPPASESDEAGRARAPEASNEHGRAQPPEESDELLLERCRQGSEAAFAALVRRHERALHRHCVTMVGQSAASDATQEAFLSAWSAIRSGAEVRRVRPWLFTIAHRKALGLLRERRRAPVELLAESLSNGVSSAEQAQRTAAARETLAVLAALPDQQRAALLGVAVHGRSGRQVASQLGVSESSARQLVFRARATLRAGTAVCVGPPLLLARWIRRLLGTGRRLGGTAGGGVGSESAVATAKVAAVAVLGVATVGAGALRLTARPHRQSAERGTLVAPRSHAAALARDASTMAGAPVVSAGPAASAERRTVGRARGPHRFRLSPPAPAGAALGSATPGGDALGGSAATGAESAAAPVTATAAPATGRAQAGAVAGEPASALLATAAPTAAVAPGLAHQLLPLGGAGAGGVRDTVVDAGGAVRKAVQGTAATAEGTAATAKGAVAAAEGTVATAAKGAVATAEGTVATAKGAVGAVTSAAGVNVAAPGSSSQPAGASVATSPAATTASGGQAAADTVQGETAAGSQALAPVSDAASSASSAAGSTVTQTLGAVTSTASGGVGEVAQGATGAVSTLGRKLTGR